VQPRFDAVRVLVKTVRKSFGQITLLDIFLSNLASLDVNLIEGSEALADAS
jgi:hypothetical protein